MNADEFIRRNYGELKKTRYELQFADVVLRNVPDLDFAHVQVQTPLVDRGRTRRRIDFTIVEPSGVRIALEVDGYDKTNTGTGMTRQEFADWSRREQDIVSQGWRLLRFANSEVDRDPQHCIDSVRWTLALSRAFADDTVRAKERATELEQELRQAESRAAFAEGRLANLVIEADGASLRPELSEELAIARTTVAGDRAAVGEVTERALAEVLRVEVSSHHLAMTRLGSDVDRGESDLFHEALQRAKHLERENRNMKTLVISLAAIAVSIAVVVGVLAASGVLGESDGDGTQRPSSANSALRGGPSCDAAVPWQDAGSLVGRSGTVVGPVLSGTYRDRVQGKPTFLNVGTPFGDNRGFTVVIFGENRSKFGGAPESDFDEETIAVTGRVTEFSGRAQIVINTPSAIERCGA